MTENYYKNQDEAPYGVARLGPKYKLIDIFEKFPRHEYGLNNFFDYVAAGLIGFMLPTSMNFFTGHKVYRNFHYHIGGTTTFVVAMHCMKLYQKSQEEKKQAICRDYISKNPDKFGEIEHKKFKDVLHDWYPSREI